MKIRQKIKNTPVLGELFIKLYFLIYPNKKLGYWIHRYLKNDAAMLVQIGSNDGQSGDPIFEALHQHKQWKALLVEPVPYLFERLKANYASDSRFTFENVAINDGQMQSFYAIKAEAKNHIPELPPWFDQLGSFYKENILKHFKGRLEPFIEEIKLQGLSLNDLFLKHSLKSVDLLHIDTEGYDWNILKQLKLDAYTPTLIIYEQKHLSKEEKNQSIQFLHSDYFIFDFGTDFLAIKQTIFKKKDSYLFKDKQVIPLAR